MNKKKTRQKQINNMLKGVKCSYSPYDAFVSQILSQKQVSSYTFGNIMRISLFKLLIALDFIIPTFRLITLISLKYRKQLSNIEVMRVTIKKD